MTAAIRGAPIHARHPAERLLLSSHSVASHVPSEETPGLASFQLACWGPEAFLRGFLGRQELLAEGPGDLGVDESRVHPVGWYMAPNRSSCASHEPQGAAHQHLQLPNAPQLVLSRTLPAPGPSRERLASDDFLAVLVPGGERGGGRRQAGRLCHSRLRSLRGIPIELFLMCFNFHFLLLENTDGDSLPLAHTEHGADGERCAANTCPPLPCLESWSRRPSLAAALGLSFPSCERGLVEVSPKAPHWLHSPLGSGLEQGRKLQLDTGRKGCPV